MLPFSRYSHLKIENCRFYQPLPCLTPSEGWTPWDSNVIYTPLKSKFNGLQFHRWYYEWMHESLFAMDNNTRTRKPSCRWQTRVTRKHAEIDPIRRSTCLQRCRWQYWSIFIRLAVGPSEICEIPRNSPKIQTYRVQGHPRSSILVPIESPYVTCY